MDSTEAAIWLAIDIILLLAIGVGAWFCFRRTRAKAFLAMGALLVLWPWFDAMTHSVYRYFLVEVMAGRRPWLFPFSRMVSGRNGWTTGELPPGEFLTKLSAVLDILHLLLWVIVLFFLARSFRRAGAAHGVAVIDPPNSKAPSDAAE